MVNLNERLVDFTESRQRTLELEEKRYLQNERALQLQEEGIRMQKYQMKMSILQKLLEKEHLDDEDLQLKRKLMRELDL